MLIIFACSFYNGNSFRYWNRYNYHYAAISPGHPYMDKLNFFTHQDSLKQLDSGQPFSEKFQLLHRMILQRYDFVDRIAVALYDSKTDYLKTFAWSSKEQSSLTQYQSKMSESPSLLEIVHHGRPRVVNDMDIFSAGSGKHTQTLSKNGFGSSYTFPMYRNDEFFGFIFFNSFQKEKFVDNLLNELDMIGHMISLMVSNEKSIVETLQATVRSAMNFTHHRDPETAAHIDRMSRFSRLIARELAVELGLDDQFVEHVFLFSPLHDLGKIAIPDHILLKPGKLSSDEFEIMKSHAEKGRQMIDDLLKNYSLSGVNYIEMLRNIAQYHHEALDGSGYPEGLKEDEIPIEARIVTVADVFDALTSHRPYKTAWSNEEAYEALRKLSGSKLDARCVEILISHQEEVEQIQRQFQENPFG